MYSIDYWTRTCRYHRMQQKQRYPHIALKQTRHQEEVRCVKTCWSLTQAARESLILISHGTNSDILNLSLYLLSGKMGYLNFDLLSQDRRSKRHEDRNTPVCAVLLSPFKQASVEKHIMSLAWGLGGGYFLSLPHTVSILQPSNSSLHRRTERFWARWMWTSTEWNSDALITLMFSWSTLVWIRQSHSDTHCTHCGTQQTETLTHHRVCTTRARTSDVFLKITTVKTVFQWSFNVSGTSFSICDFNLRATSTFSFLFQNILKL